MKFSDYLTLWRREMVSEKRPPARWVRPTLELLEERNLLSATAVPLASGPVLQLPAGFSFVASQRLVLQNDNVLEVGVTAVPNTPLGEFALAEFQADGSPIANFGNNGIVITRVGYNDSAPSAVIQPDGTILLAGTSSSNPGDGSVAATQPGFESSVLIRYNADGSLDQSFGDGGILTTASPDPSSGSGGSLTLPSPTTPQGFVTGPVLGTVQPTGGMTADSAASEMDIVDVSAAQPDGKTVVVGRTEVMTPYIVSASGDINFPSTELTVARYNADGSLDTTFAQNGVSRLTLGQFDWVGGQEIANNVIIQADGKITITARASEQGSGYGTVTVQYNPDGILDNTFGNGGVAFTASLPPSPPAASPQPSTPADPGSSISNASTPAAPPVFIAAVTAPASASDPTTSPHTPSADLTALYLSALSVSGGAPIGGLPLPGGGYGTIALATPAQIASVPAQPAPGDPFRTQISGGGSVILEDASTDPIAPLTNAVDTPPAAVDTASEPAPPTVGGIGRPYAALDMVFASFSVVDENAPNDPPAFVAVDLPADTSLALATVKAPEVRPAALPASVRFGMVGLAGLGAAATLQRRKRKGFRPSI